MPVLRSVGCSAGTPQAKKGESSFMTPANVNYHSCQLESDRQGLLIDVCFLQFACYSNRDTTHERIFVFPCSADSSHLLMRSPKLSATACILFGNLRRSPSTSQLSLMSLQISRNRLPKPSGVSVQGCTGRHFGSRALIQATAVSCSMTSCRLPGWTEASSP